MTAAPVGCLDERVLRALRMADMQLSAWENGYAFDTHGPSREAQRLVTEALAALSASRQEGWISVDERMPPPITYVIAHGRRYGDREGHKRVYVTYTGTRVFETVEDEEIAYWMPLPAAPHQSQEAQGDRHDA